MAEIGERYRWSATLDDGLVIYQVDPETGIKHGYDALPRTRIRAFELWDWKKNQRVFFVKFNPGELLTWRRRVEMAPGNETVEACHIVAKTGKGIKGVAGIFESDGRIEIVPDYLPNSEWFYPPVLHKDEA